MALLHALKTQRPDLKLIPAHLNHNLRPGSHKDVDFLQEVLGKWSLPLFTETAQPPKKGNLEEWGRNQRYVFFEALRAEQNADLISTAHHLNDDFESMFLHFLRGTRVKGLSGMLPQRGFLVRPLLSTPRSLINEYVASHEISYLEDPSNQDTKLQRNALRHEVIPKLEALSPELLQRFQEQKSYWLELQKMLEDAAQTFLNSHLDPQKGLDRKAYQTLPQPVRFTVLELWFKESTGQLIPNSQTLERWDHALFTFTSGKKTEWDEGVFLTIKNERGFLS